MNRREVLTNSVRTALLATAACALPLWYVRGRMQAAKVQANIVAGLEELGVSVGYAHEWDHVRNCYSGAATPGGPLRRIFGDHFFLKPNLVLVSEFRGNALALRDISQLKEITSIGIVDSPNIDDGIIDILLALDDNAAEQPDKREPE